jgi:hypothetical protein
VFFSTLTSNLCLVRVHASVAREILMLHSQNLSLRFSTSSVQSLQAYVENSQETSRAKASASTSSIAQSSLAGRAHIENTRPALRPYAARIEPPFSSRVASIRSATAACSIAKRTFGLGLGRTLLPLSKKRLGIVCDGRQAVPPESSHLSRSSASARQRESSRLVSGHRDNPYSHTQTYPGLGLRRGFGNNRAGHEPGLDRAALPFSSHQQIADCRGRRNRNLAGRALREKLYQLTRQALEIREGPRLNTVLKDLRRLVGRAKGMRVLRMIVREFLRRVDHFRAYQKNPELNLPATTGSLEAMNRRVRDLMRQTRSISSPQALQLWATALIRTRPIVMCNGKHFSTK